MHCRFAMLGAAGILVPDLLHSAGLGGPAAAVPWYEAGKYEYFAPPAALFASMMFLFAWAEGRRWVCQLLGQRDDVKRQGRRVGIVGLEGLYCCGLC